MEAQVQQHVPALPGHADGAAPETVFNKWATRPKSGPRGSQGHWESQRGEGRHLYARVGVNGMDTLTPKRIFQLQNL